MPKRTFTFPNSLITRVVDGDTMYVDASWEQPFFVRPAVYPIVLRIAGIDCEPGGLSAPAKQWTAKGERAYLRAAGLIEGKRLTVVTYEHYAYGGPDGTVGDWVGDIYVPTPESVIYGPSDEIALSTILLTEELAVPYDGKGKRPSAS